MDEGHYEKTSGLARGTVFVWSPWIQKTQTHPSQKKAIHCCAPPLNYMSIDECGIYSINCTQSCFFPSCFKYKQISVCCTFLSQLIIGYCKVMAKTIKCSKKGLQFSSMFCVSLVCLLDFNTKTDFCSTKNWNIHTILLPIWTILFLQLNLHTEGQADRTSNRQKQKLGHNPRLGREYITAVGVAIQVGQLPEARPPVAEVVVVLIRVCA